MSVKVSRRREVIAVVNLLENGVSTKKAAQVLAAYLAENHQTRSAELYLRDIRGEIERRFGHVSAEVASARQLSTELEKQVEHFIKKSTGARTVETIKTVEPDLVGGVVISTTDAEMDGSIKTRLQKLRKI
jgi:F-type H+-transporting ATPase subunit delta